MIISTLNKLEEAEKLYCEKLREDIESMYDTIAGRKRVSEQTKGVGYPLGRLRVRASSV